MKTGRFLREHQCVACDKVITWAPRYCFGCSERLRLVAPAPPKNGNVGRPRR